MYEQPGFYRADCMEAMKQFPDQFFELAIVDSPYGIGADKFSNGNGAKGHNHQSTSVKVKNRLNTGSGKLKDRVLNQSDCSWDAKPPSKAYFEELFRVSKNQIIWGGNYFDLPPTRGIVVWDKMQPWENFSQVELAWTSFDKPAALVKILCSGNTGEKKIHPCQKPIQLYTWLLNKYAKEGDKILDTHVGSGSSLIACYRGGYDYWGFEINEGYYSMTTERLNKEKKQITIFELMG